MTLSMHSGSTHGRLQQLLGLVWIALALFGLRISINAGAMGYGYNVSVGIELWYGVLLLYG